MTAQSPKEAAPNEINRQIPVHTIDISDADGYVVSEQGALVRELTKLGLFDATRYVYCAFVPSLLPRVIERGSYKSIDDNEPDIIYGCRAMLPPEVEEAGIYDEPDTGIFNYFTDDEYPLREERGTYGMIAVYDAEALSWLEIDGDTYISSPEYTFKNPENKLAALVAIVRVTDQR
ncbi:hypothetical protein A2154_01155 [Candidatus Gottesmanbacteria bacterium RBG_16_43_7]|uniref:Uncharacterized protein n=1 Tax=Candidatus Gottesmanbacteria bacterium RBG_16_43_7 TaxID=1798373 RepID=A0A1F5ZA75_9BACT|nr:MAG: hypothetical protein A2154_01155 [Candidatus Gottesmanbacteria bacterium RBG_16_43_7]